jgi:hypothetical protein
MAMFGDQIGNPLRFAAGKASFNADCETLVPAELAQRPQEATHTGLGLAGSGSVPMESRPMRACFCDWADTADEKTPAVPSTDRRWRRFILI